MTTSQKEQILALRAKGEGYGAIAAILNISKNTVKSYCRRNNLSSDTPTMPAQNTIYEDSGVLCKHCGSGITSQSKNNQKTFCTEKCRTAWWNANRQSNPSHQTTCAHCGIEFNTRGNKSRKYCSHPCYIAGRFGEGAAGNDHDKRAI